MANFCVMGHILDFLCVMKDNYIVEQKLQILRLKCKVCQSTHAILTRDMIPFSVYSFSLMLNIVRSVLMERVPILKKGKEANVSFQMIYRLLRLWQFFVNKYTSFNIISQNSFQNCYVQFLFAVFQRKKLKKSSFYFEVIYPHSF